MRPIGDAEQYRSDHTLQPNVTDPRDVDHPDAYQPQDDDEGSVHIDPSKAVLVDQMYCSLIQGESEPGIAFQLQGRINQSEDRVTVTHIASLHSIAKIVGQLIEMSISTDSETARNFQSILQQEMENQAHNHDALVGTAQKDDDQES